MKTHNLIASFAAVLFTAVSLSAVNYNVKTPPAAPSSGAATHITNLAPVRVSPTAEELRAAAMLPDNSVAMAGPLMSGTGGLGGAEQLNLIGSQLVMPYYSFGTKFGRVNKE